MKETNELSNPELSKILGDEPSGITLTGNKNSKKYFAVRKFFQRANKFTKHGDKKYDWSFCNSDEIAYCDGYAWVTDGHIAIANKENISPIYQNCAIDMYTNEIYSNLGIPKVDAVIYSFIPILKVDVKKLLCCIEEQQKWFKELTDKETKARCRRKDAGNICIHKCKNEVVYITHKLGMFIKEFTEKFGVGEMTISIVNNPILKIQVKGCLVLTMLSQKWLLSDDPSDYDENFIVRDYSICEPIK